MISEQFSHILQSTAKKGYVSSGSAKSNSGHLQHGRYSWHACLKPQVFDIPELLSISGLDTEVFECQLKEWVRQIINQNKKQSQAVLYEYNDHYLSGIVQFLLIICVSYNRRSELFGIVKVFEQSMQKYWK